jgi:WS/DGAT/MGAT family acyltransferase
MSKASYTRLSALDATFLDVETHNAHMHVGAVGIFDAAPLRSNGASIDLDRIRRLIEYGFRRFPRYRQKLAWIPLFNHPVWVDDDRFNMNYHVRHTSLPKPGDERQLKRLAGRIMSQQLDRGKPLWEMWIVEGLEGDRLAIISKAHHCMVDGVGGVDLIGSTMGAEARDVAAIDWEPSRWIPRPRPSSQQLLRDELWRVATEPASVVRAVLAGVRRPRASIRTLRNAAEGLAEAVAAGLRGASDTQLNVEIGPHRRFDWTSTALADLRGVREALHGTVNDVVLAVASGALGRFLAGRGEDVAELDFRAMVPVNTRAASEHDALGNRIAMLVARLPVAERDSRRRLELVREEMTRLKQSHQAQGVEALENLSDATLYGLFTSFARLSASSRAYNVVVTNVPGPQLEAYLLRSPMRAVYPLVPLNHNQAVGIAVFSYNGTLHWGFNADYDEVPDLHDLVHGVEQEFERLRNAALLATPTNDAGVPGHAA